MAVRDYSELYDEYYFRHLCEQPYERTQEWLGFFDRIADHIVREIQPQTALDVGCAMGFLVEGLRARGVEAFGIDISEYAIAQVRADLKPYCRLASIADPLPGRYDLVVCIEVLEHLPAAMSDRAVANLCQAGDDILFSSTPFDFREATHFNVQPPEHWAERFALEGFVRDVDFDATFITAWAVRFRRRRQPWHRVVRDYERRFWSLSKNNTDLRQLATDMRRQLAAAERAAQATDGNLQALSAELAQIRRGRVWRLAQALRRVRRALTPAGRRPAGPAAPHPDED